jgi:hypothetical protein
MDNEDYIPALELFCKAMKWVKARYATYGFFAERDIVWTVQKKLLRLVSKASLPYEVINEYRMPPDPTSGQEVLVDLVIFDNTTERRNTDPVELAVEFKYQWKSDREHVPRGKFPLIVWKGRSSVEEDIQKARRYHDRGLAKSALALLIDEGGHFHKNHKHPPENESVWEDWKISDSSLAPVWVLWTTYRIE